MINELYKLEVITSDEIFEGLALNDTPSVLGRNDLMEDMMPGYGVSDVFRNWHQSNLQDVWKAPAVYGDISDNNDFPGINMILPAFSERAYEVLGSVLEANGELLPLESKSGKYYFYNLTNVIDALDLNKSNCDFWCDPPTTAIDIARYEFNEKTIGDSEIFRIIENPIATIVSDKFLRRCQEAGLKGLCFRKIWPFDNDKLWREENIVLELT